jgi:zinc protease
VGQVTLEQINALVKEYIRDTNRDILLLAPEKDKSTLPDSATVSAWMDSVASEKLSAFADVVNQQPLLAVQLQPGKVVGTKTVKPLGITELGLGNGVRVILKPTEFKNDEILFLAFSPGGSSLYPDSEYQNAANAALIAGFGVGVFNPIQLNKLLAGKIVEVNPYIGERAEGIQGSTAPKDLETTLQLLYLRFTAPRKDTILFNNILNSSKEMVANRYSDPKNVFTDSVNRVLGNYNFRRSPPSLEKLKQIDLEKIDRIYRERFSDASGFTFVFVGSFTIDSIRPLLEKYLGSLPSLHKKEIARDLGIHIPPGKLSKKVFGGTENKATVRMVFSGDYMYGPENNITLQAIKEILSIKITQHLREDESEVYSPSVQVSFNKYPKQRYSFTVAFGCAPANADHLMESVEKEMAALRQNGPEAEDLVKFRAEYKRIHESQMTQNNYWLDYLVNQYENQEEPTATLDYTGRLERVSAAMVQEGAKKWLDGKNEIRFELLPETK